MCNNIFIFLLYKGTSSKWLGQGSHKSQIIGSSPLVPI